MLDLDECTNTFIGVRVLPPNNTAIYEHLRKQGVPVNKNNFELNLHVTILSTYKDIDIDTVTHNEKYLAKFAGYDIFEGAKGEQVLVMLLYAPGLVHRHQQLIQQHLVPHIHPNYIPHITLCRDYKGSALQYSKLAPFDSHIILGNEYSEQLRVF